MTAMSVPVQSSVVTNIDRLLPQPAEDAAIIGALSKIRDGIKNHAQNYYHNAPVRHDAVDETRLVELANTTAMPTSAIRNLLLNPATRLPTIRLFLGHLILSRCTGRTDGQLLPRLSCRCSGARRALSGLRVAASCAPPRA